MIIRILLLSGLLAPAAFAQTYEPPRTPDGRPDLQGVWGTNFSTPLERPSGIPYLVASTDQARQLAVQSLKETPDLIDPDFFVFNISDLATVHGSPRTSIIVAPDDGRLPYTEKARKLSEASFVRDDTSFDNPEERPTFERCVAGMGQPPLRQIPAYIPSQFVQTKDTIAITTEDAASLRVIHLDDKAPPPDVIRSFEGWSAGHWEGDTLVVVTTHTRSDDPYREGFGRPILVEPDSKVIERFTRISPTELFYQFTVEDADLYTRPWLGEYVFTLSDQASYEYACHEANYALTNMLKAGRVGRQTKPKDKPKD